jgi:peptidoglycan DL-endopeptidase CwlO
MRRLLFIPFLLVSLVSAAQNKKLDQLEMLFDQGHYRKVYRKANVLMDKPEYDFSQLPAYYKGLSLLQLAQNEFWRKKNPNALDKAEELLLSVKRDSDGALLFTAHKHELEWVKADLVNWSSDLKRMNDTKSFSSVQRILQSVFDGIFVSEPEVNTDKDTTVYDPSVSNIRKSIIRAAEKQLGVPYQWAGSSPEGFDCSGFTSYVFAQNGKELPRRAADQFSKGIEVKDKNVKPGDLVFFDNGSGISHVGIVISNPGEPLKMIHSASSKGIIVTDVSTSEYWTKRLYGFATYVN